MPTSRFSECVSSAGPVQLCPADVIRGCARLWRGPFERVTASSTGTGAVLEEDTVFTIDLTAPVGSVVFRPLASSSYLVLEFDGGPPVWRGSDGNGVTPRMVASPAPGCPEAVRASVIELQGQQQYRIELQEAGKLLIAQFL